MDQDATWCGGRRRSKQHCARWDPAPPPQKKAGTVPQFSVHVCCCQTSGWIKMPLGMEVGFSPGHTVLDADPAPLPLKRGTAPTFRPMFIVVKRLDGSRCHLVRRKGSAQATLCYMGIQLHPIRGTASPIFGLCPLWPNGRPSDLLLSTCLKPGLAGFFKREYLMIITAGFCSWMPFLLQ